ncbi:hypothetical protein NFX46_01865 [Streptomyces phaeoluteigriseus]|uniref:Uncharacterized protein n=1 Tax=Streptomyces phaeoluteigriseus TaxID=114686 RepID=A0ABY4Z0W9_9ACTN|nr:hypothetical protein [Streptomyces phaeoluteigriseus]USQ82621.1 hypothetical protein NFX46_01865 [Streptomyces phaeoluteigriseus]
MLAWISRLLRRRPDAGEPEVSPGQREASAALGRAQADRAQLHAQRSEVKAEARVWRHRREENHFAERIAALYRGAEQWET